MAFLGSSFTKVAIFVLVSSGTPGEGNLFPSNCTKTREALKRLYEVCD